ncbi:MAG: transglutaminase TgpA family protein [Bryobacteraceae bacterium]
MAGTMVRTGAAESVERFFQFSLLGLVASGYLAVAGSGYLDLPTMVLTAAGLLLRALMIAGIARFEISLYAVNWVTLAYVCFYPIDSYLLVHDFQRATVHLVFFLVVIKILTGKTNRDHLYTAAIAFVELLAAAILSASLNFFAFLALYLLCAIAAFTSAEIRRALQKSLQKTNQRPSRMAGSRGLRVSTRLASLTGVVTAGILLLTAGLFFLLPRTANAALRQLISRRYHLTGFSNEVTLGQVGEIQNDSHVVMHVKSYSRDLPPNLKWRGAALSRFNGRRWSESPLANRLMPVERGTVLVADEAQRRRTGRRILYRVDLNVADSDAVFIAGVPEFLNVGHARLIRTPNDGFRFAYVPLETAHYEVSSFVGSPPDGALTESQRQRYLQLPPLDGRIAPLAISLAGSGSDFERATAIQNRLRRDYAYTLQLPSSAAADPLANFLFERRKGHCEYFASAMTVMLRTMGIPARIVNGFQSGTYNPISQLYAIRASDAHSWVEAYIPPLGWRVFDPTPLAARPNANSWWAKAGMYVDAADTFWQEWVLSYDLGRQVNLAERFDETARRVRWNWVADSTRTMSRWKREIERWMAVYAKTALGVAIGLAVLIPVVIPLTRMLATLQRVRKIGRGQATAADATLLYARMLDLMKRRGYQKPPWFTPREFAANLPASHAAATVAEFTHAYNALRFGGDAQAATRLGKLLEELAGAASR